MEKWRKDRKIDREIDRERDRKKKEQESAEAISGLKTGTKATSLVFALECTTYTALKYLPK